MTTETTVRKLAEIIADLSKDIPERLLGSKNKGGRNITIFTWVTTQRFLDAYAPGWQGEATLTYSGERIGCVYRLCIPTSDMGLVCRAATGDDSEDEDEMPEFANDQEKKKWTQEQRGREFGSPTTRAEGQAFKRAAARFGFGMYLRDGRHANAPAPQAAQPALQQQVNRATGEIQTPAPKNDRVVIPGLGDRLEQDFAEQHPDYNDAPPPPEPDDFLDAPAPQATQGYSNKATEKQVKAMYAIARANKRLSENQLNDYSRERFSVLPSELTKAQASQLIDYLKEGQ